MLMKRATTLLQQQGINLEVHSCSVGYTLNNPRFKAQSGTVYPTALAAVRAASAGVRPTEIRTSANVEAVTPAVTAHCSTTPVRAGTLGCLNGLES